MPTTSRQVLFKHMDDLGIITETVDHPPVRTVSESHAVDRALPGGHTKNLFLKDAKGALFLIVAHVDTEVDLKGLPKRIGSARLSFGKPELLKDALGVEPGAVTAFAAINDTECRVSIIIDLHLERFESVNCHPLENNATTNIARDDLLRFIRATGHEPRILNLTNDEPT